MDYQVKGIQRVDYVAKSGNHVEGVNLHCEYESKYVDGLAIEKIFISNKIESPIFQVGDRVSVLYNRYGSVERIELLE